VPEQKIEEPVKKEELPVIEMEEEEIEPFIQIFRGGLEI